MPSRPVDDADDGDGGGGKRHTCDVTEMRRDDDAAVKVVHLGGSHAC